MPPPFVTTLERGGAVKYRPALFAPRAAAVFFFSRRPPECEVNGFGFETITNHSVIKIMETLRSACLEKITGTDVEKVD